MSSDQEDYATGWQARVRASLAHAPSENTGRGAGGAAHGTAASLWSEPPSCPPGIVGCRGDPGGLQAVAFAGGPFTLAKQVFMSTWGCPLDWGQVGSPRPASAKRPTPCEAPPLPDPHSSLTPAGPVWNSRREDGRGSLLPLPQLPAGECLVDGGRRGQHLPPAATRTVRAQPAGTSLARGGWWCG